jgi:multiple sugar transport system ATP-binding protein
VIEHLTKVFPAGGSQKVHALNDLSLSVPENELLVLLGPSGCGKTTTLRLVAGLETPDSGSIEIGGKKMDGVLPKDRDVAMVFQNHALYPHLTVYENIAFGLKLRRHAPKEVADRVGEAVGMLGLDSCLERRPAELSGGERQRVALARALVRRPRVLLLDEPLSQLDAPTRRQMRAELTRLHRQLGFTMLFVTHDQAEAMALGQRIAVLRSGELQQVDSPLAVYRKPTNMFVAGFVGSPPMNLVHGKIVQAPEAGGRYPAPLVFQEQENQNKDHEATPAVPTSGVELTTTVHVPENGSPKGKPLVLHLNEIMAKGLRPHVGKSVMLGIRPEDISEQPSTTGPADQTLDGIVEGVELSGPEAQVTFAGAARPVIARFPASRVPEIGQKVPLTFRLDAALFFDAESGKAL